MITIFFVDRTTAMILNYNFNMGLEKKILIQSKKTIQLKGILKQYHIVQKKTKKNIWEILDMHRWNQLTGWGYNCLRNRICFKSFIEEYTILCTTTLLFCRLLFKKYLVSIAIIIILMFYHQKHRYYCTYWPRRIPLSSLSAWNLFIILWKKHATWNRIIKCK